MKKLLFSLYYLFALSILSLTAQSFPILGTQLSNTAIVNQEKELHANTNEVILAASAFKLNAYTNSGKSLFFQVVYDLNQDGKISRSEWLTEPLPSDKKGNLRGQVVEINPKIVWELNKRPSPTKAFIRAAQEPESLLSASLTGRDQSSMSFYFGQASPYILELMVNDNFIKNERETQHFTSNQIVTIDGNFLNINAIVNTEEQGKLFGVIAIDLNRDGKIDPSREIIGQPLVTDNGIFEGELPLSEEILRLLLQADEPFPVIFKVGEDVEALYDSAYTSAGYASILFRAIGPVVVADDEEADETIPGQWNCVLSTDSIKNIRIANYKSTGIKITQLVAPSIPTSPTISLSLPIVIDVGSSVSIELKYNASFESYFPYNPEELCFNFPISFEYVEIEKIIFVDDDEDPYLDTIYSSNPILVSETLSICYCDLDPLDFPSQEISRSALNNNSVINSQELQVAPNPVMNSITLDYYLELDSEISMDLINNRGEIIRTLKTPTNVDKGRYKEIFDLSEFPSGMYFIRFNKKNTSSILKVVKL